MGRWEDGEETGKETGRLDCKRDEAMRRDEGKKVKPLATSETDNADRKRDFCARQEETLYQQKGFHLAHSQAVFNVYTLSLKMFERSFHRQFLSEGLSVCLYMQFSFI